MWKAKVFFAAFLFDVAIFSACAAEKLFDFESEDGGWKGTWGENKAELSRELPSEGSQGILFSGPKWDGGGPIWPAFETREFPKDWAKFDRLAFTVYNDGDSPMMFNVFISDSKIPLREGAHFPDTLQPYSSKQIMLPLKQAFSDKNVNAADISAIHCYTENPGSPVRFFLDGFTLLEPGEAVQEASEEYREKTREKLARFLAPRVERMKAEADKLDLSGLPPESAQYIKARINEEIGRLARGESNYAAAAIKGGTMPEWDSIKSVIAAMRAFAASNADNILLGYASGMEKVLPHVPIFRPLPETIRIEAARNEKEAVQLIVMPYGKDAKNVSVKLTAFEGPAGKLPASAMSAVPVGFVETKFVPHSGSKHVGFWPDPLMSFLETAEVKPGDAQPFWIKADISANQPAGVYAGKAEVMVDGKTAYAAPVSVRVRDFTLPNRSMLPLAVTFWPSDSLMPQCNPEFSPAERDKPATPSRAWKKHKKEWRDMLAGYYLMIDTLYEYGGWNPELDLFAELEEDGKLGMFNLGYYGPATEDPADNYGMQPTIDRIRPRYEKAKELGLLKYAYIYGCDEANASTFAAVNRAAEILKKEFPDVPIFTTAYDESYGTDGRLGEIDWFCPLTPKFDAEKAETARKAGKQVWWYICLAPVRPYANNFIEADAIEIRLLMGAMSAKYRPDGFLYYQTSLWNNTTPISSGPYTDWVAQSFPGYNGDGNWTYPGPDATPLGSIRLENFRDGLEDYAYVKILEQKLDAAKKSGANPQWQKEAQAALAVPASVAENMTEYTRNPEQLKAWRSRLADLIESAPTK